MFGKRKQKAKKENNPGKKNYSAADTHKKTDDDAQEDEIQADILRGIREVVEARTKAKGFRQKLKKFLVDNKKKILFFSLLGVATAILLAVGLHTFLKEKTSAPVPIAAGEAEKPAETNLFESLLDGVKVSDEAAAKKHPLAIVVENHTDARPQAGLDKASIIYEALAEGGITRFLAVYGEEEAEKVGPVRSARTYFVDWAHGYNAYFAHVGGNMDALDQIPIDRILDLDQFKYPSGYWRERSTGVSTEHTMFASTIDLRKQAEKNKYPTANNFNIFKFKDDPSADTLPESQKVTIDYSNSSYKVQFIYDKATNSYKRYLGGKLHTDRLTKKGLTPKNVIVMTVTSRSTVTRINEPGLAMDTIGSGKAKIYMDGKEITGTWKKENKESREMFYDETGNEVVFDRGQFWICVVPPNIKPVIE